MCLYFVGHGAWSEFVECVVQESRTTGRPPLYVYRSYLWGMTKMYWFVFTPILALALFALRGAWHGATVGVRACLGWWASLFLTVQLSGFYRDQYFVLIMPAVALLAAYGAESLAPLLEPKRRHWQSHVAAGLAVAASIWTLFVHGGFYKGPSPELVCRLLYGRNPFPESVELGKLLRENSEPTDTIFVCGSEPQILFYAERASASRYTVVYPLFGKASSRSRQQSAIEDVRLARPKFVVLVVPDTVPSSYVAAGDSLTDAMPKLMSEISEFVQQEYSTYVAVALGMDWKTRMIHAVSGEKGERQFARPPEQGETVTVHVWERRDSKEYTGQPTNVERRMHPQREKLRRILDDVRQRIDRATQASGRATNAVRLVAVTKQVDPSIASELVELGVSDLAENRPQELWRKQQLVSGPVRWHLVGTLQKNKARRTLPLVHLIHSVDSAALLARLDELAVELNLRPEVLLEVNTSGEATKHGFAVHEVREVVAGAAPLARVQIRGLMTIAPYDEDPERARPFFATLRELRDHVAHDVPPTGRFTELSMGMSGDFEAAIAEGATIVRIGSALFEAIKEPA
jgi:pyridoxal phosphate enzyme (YggS family)